MHDLVSLETMSAWMVHYGSFTLFILLALGIIALPVPEETLLTITGILLYKGLLNIPGTLLAAYGGSMCGITASYLIGKNVGSHLLHRYGSWCGLTEPRIQQAHNWFEKYGKWTLSIGYFIPGIRHLTGISAGITELEYKHFAIFAYSGAFLWVSTFISAGYFFGDYWISLMSIVEDKLSHLIIAAVTIIALFFIVRYIKKKFITGAN